jgi:MFS transporter, DHA1 family, multidrug resistance protein
MPHHAAVCTLTETIATMEKPLPGWQTRGTGLSFVVLLATLTMLGPFSIVTYLPSFPEMSQNFGATAVQMQLTLSAYLATFAIMSLFHGAISDSFGRRSVILAYLGIFIGASLGCALAQNFTQLLVFRALQGLSAGGGIIIGRAMIRDAFTGHEGQRMMAMVTMIFGIAPAIGPIIGGWLQAAFGWRSVFVFLTLYSMLLLVCCYLRLPETLPRASRQPFTPRPLLANYLKLMKSARYWLLSSALAFNFSGLFLYISSAPVIIYQLLSLKEDQFAWLFVPSIGGFVFGAFLSGRLAGRLTPVRTVKLGYAVMLLAVAAGVGYHALFPAALPWTVLAVMMYTTGLSLVMPSLTLFSLDLFPQNRGLAASLQVFQNSIFNTITAAAISPFVSGTGLGLSLTAALFLACGAISTLTYFRLQKSAEAAP